VRRLIAAWRFRTAAVAVAGVAGSVLVTVTAPGWSKPLPVGRVEVPGLRGDMVRQGAFWVGMALLAAGWLGLVHLARVLPGGTRIRLAVVCAVAGLWAVPLLAGPPLQSRDAYSYAAQAEMASRGIDPSTAGPSALGDARFADRVSRNWVDAPAPYGPAAGGLGAAVAELAGHDPDGILAATKLVAMVALVATACMLPAVARAHGVAPEVAVALGLANPLVALHLVGGAHNDALVAALVVAAFWARARAKRGAPGGVARQHRADPPGTRAKRGWQAVAVGLAALAAAVKLPALVAVFYLGWSWGGGTTPAKSERGRRLARLSAGALAVAAAAAMHIGLSFLTGTGWGVLGAMAASTHVTTDLSLPQVLAMLVEADPPADLLDRMRLVCAVAAAALAVLVWLRSDRLGALRATGLTLVLLALCAPVLHPWYPVVGLILLAAAPMGRWRPVYVSGVLVLAFALRAGGGGMLADAGEWRPSLAAGAWGLVACAAVVALIRGRGPLRRRRLATT